MRGKNTAAILAVAATLTFLVAPVADAQVACAQPTMCPNKPTPTSLYFHIFDVFNNFPINTQMPHPGFFKVGGTNFPTVVEPNSGTNYDFNTIYGYSTSGPVEYDFIENGQPRFHPERGIAQSVKIDGNSPATVHLYVSLRDVLGTEVGPNFMPAYTFRVEMRTGNQLGDEAALNSGDLIMHGQKTAHLARTTVADSTIANQTGPDGYPIWVPNSDGVIEYVIPMTIDSTTIPQKEGYHMRIDWFQTNAESGQPGDDKAAEGYMRLVSDDKYHPRLDLSILNPVYIEFIHPQVAAGILLIHTCENSPWGTYDVDVANMTVEIQDSNGRTVDADLQQVISQNAHVHNLHDKCAEVTYLWRFRGDPDNGIPAAPDGDYTIKVSVQNAAHTATATGTGSFHLEGKEAYGVSELGETVSNAPDTETEKSSPGAGLLVVLCVLGAAVVLRRRGA